MVIFRSVIFKGFGDKARASVDDVCFIQCCCSIHWFHHRHSDSTIVLSTWSFLLELVHIVFCLSAIPRKIADVYLFHYNMFCWKTRQCLPQQNDKIQSSLRWIFRAYLARPSTNYSQVNLQKLIRTIVGFK